MSLGKVGLVITNFTMGVEDDRLFERVGEYAKAAEDSGFSSLWVADHMYQVPQLGGPDQPMLEAFTLLGALAVRTKSIQIGTLVTGVTLRNPALVAKMMTTLDIISKGRAVLGMGCGWYQLEHESLGFALPSVRERIDRLEEAAQLCRAMFVQDHASFNGKYYQIKDARNQPRPLQRGGPKVLIGGGGERRTLRLVAQYADKCNLVGDLTTIVHKIKVLEQHCKDIGRDPSEITVTRFSTLVITKSEEATASTKHLFASIAGAEALAGLHIGQENEVMSELTKFSDAGIQEHIFIMPFAAPEEVAQAGQLLAS